MIDGRDAGHIYLPISAADPHAIALLMRARSRSRPRPRGAAGDLSDRVVPDPQVFEALPLDEMRALQMYPLQAAAWVGAVLGAIALAAERLGSLRRAVVHAQPAHAGRSASAWRSARPPSPSSAS